MNCVVQEQCYKILYFMFFSSIVSKNYVGKQELILKSIGYFSVIVLVLLKGMWHVIFDLHFFHDSNPSRPLINRLKYFRILFRFCWDIRIFKKLGCQTLRCVLCNVYHPAESDSAVCSIPWSQTTWCASHRGRGSSSAVCITSRSKTAHCGVKLHTAKSKSKS